MTIKFSEIKYELPFRKLKTEEELLEVLSNLRNYFDEIRESGFGFFNKDDEITELGDFLSLSFSESLDEIIIKGSGELMGASFENAVLKFDRRDLYNLANYWNNGVYDSCGSCENISIHYGETEGDDKSVCLKDHSRLWYEGCRDYSPKITNSSGGKARKLNELIEEAADF